MYFREEYNMGDAEKPEEAVTSKEAGAKTEKKSGTSEQTKGAKSDRARECAGCGKALRKKLWYYRNNAFYCTKKCYKRKLEENRKKPAK